MKHTEHAKNDEELITRIREALDRSLQDIDEQLVQRLDSARRRALQTEAVLRSADEETLVQIARENQGDDHSLSSDIEKSLDQIRLNALARIPEKQGSNNTRSSPGKLLQDFLQSYWKIPAGVMASAFVLVTSVSLINNSNAPETFRGENELALIASAEEIELYENLEFYLWLFDNEFTTQ